MMDGMGCPGGMALFAPLGEADGIERGFRFARTAFACLAPGNAARADIVIRQIKVVTMRRQLPEDMVAEQQEAFCRSEEHTSELQSLMRISYAVFCLKKKKKKQDKRNIIRHQ